jgi:hypothetical protein
MGWLPQGVLVSRYFPGRQTVAGIVLKLASRDVRPARGPRMRQGRRPVRERPRRRPERSQGRAPVPEKARRAKRASGAVAG